MVYLLVLVSHLNDRAAGVYRVADVPTCQAESEKIRAQLPAESRVLLMNCREAEQARYDLSGLQCVFAAAPHGDKWVYVYNCGRVSLPPDSQVLPPGDHTAYMVLSQVIDHDNMKPGPTIFAPATEAMCNSHAETMLSKQTQVRGVKTLYARCMNEEAVRQQLSAERCTLRSNTHPEMYTYVCDTNLQVAPAAQVLPKEE